MRISYTILLEYQIWGPKGEVPLKQQGQKHFAFYLSKQWKF